MCRCLTDVVVALVLFSAAVVMADQPATGFGNAQQSDSARAVQMDKHAKALIVSGKFAEALEAMQSAQQLAPDKQRAQRIDRISVFVAIRSPEKPAADVRNKNVSRIGKAVIKPPKSSSVLSPLLSDASDVAPPMPDLEDLAVLEDFVDTGSITTTLNLLKQLYGELTPEQEAILEKQFSQYYAYPADEVKKYFKALNKELFRLVALKTRLSVEMEGYGRAAAEAQNALVFNSEKHAQSASRHLLQRRRRLLEIQQQFAEINHHLNDIGSPPNALEIKQKREKQFEELINGYARQSGEDSRDTASGLSIDGIWELRPSDKVSILSSYSGEKRVREEQKAIRDVRKTIVGNFSPFSSNQIYLKKMADVGDGFSLVYLYQYHVYGSGFGKEVDDSLRNEVASAAGGQMGKTDQGREYGDSFELLLMKQTGENQYTLYSDLKQDGISWKLRLTRQGEQLLCAYETYPPVYNNGKGGAGLFKYQWHLMSNPASVPAMKNGVWSWQEIQEDTKYELEQFAGLSEKEKQTPLSGLDDEAGQIQYKLAMYKLNQAVWQKQRSQYKGVIVSQIKTGDMVWQLGETKVDHVYVSADDFTVSLETGRIQIWKTGYFLSADGEYERKRVLQGTFTWTPPGRVYSLTDSWEIDLNAAANMPAVWKAVIPESMEYNFGYNEDSPIVNKEQLLPSKAIKMSDPRLKKKGQIALKVQLHPKDTDPGFYPTVDVTYQFNLLPRGRVKEKPFDVEASQTWMIGKEDFYKLLIEQIQEEIVGYRSQLGKAAGRDQKKQIEWLILGKQADLQQQKDLLAELKTGEFQHTKTAWDRRNAEISGRRFIEESNRYQLKVQQARYRTEMINKIGTMSKLMINQDDPGVRDWAMHQREAALKAGDNRKLNEIYVSLQKRYRQNLEQGRIVADSDVAYWDDVIEGTEYVKETADTAFMIASTVQSGGSMYLYAGYTGLTNGISNGIASGVEHAVKSLNMATMVAGSAYDGYNYINPKTGKKEGFAGAAKNVGMTLAILGVCHVGIKAVTKTTSLASNAYKKYAFESALTAQEREMSLTLVHRYEQKLAKLEQMVQRGESKAAQKQATLLEKETIKLMANPHAKNYLKYRGAQTTQQMYVRFEKKVRSRVEARFRKVMEEKGWRNLKLKEFRNASSLDSVGMDWDYGLIEDELETAIINGRKVKVLYKNGKPRTIRQFQDEAGEEFKKVYFKETGYSAEGSFATLTTSVNEEAFKDVAILTDASKAAKRYARSTEKTVKYKAEHMMSNKSQGFITRAGKLLEASRGLAKEIRTKLIPNLRQSKNKLYLNERIAYMQQLEVVLQDFGENRIDAIAAERAVRNLTGKSLVDLPAYISRSLRKAIIAK
jgi:hypothetical protein